MDDPRGEHVGLPGSGTCHHEQRSGTVFDREPLLGLESLENVGPRFAEPEAELLGHERRRPDWLGSTEGARASLRAWGPLPPGHRPKAGGSAAA